VAMVLLAISIIKTKAVIDNICNKFSDCINNLKYIKVGIIIGKTKICDTADAKLLLPIINACPVADMLIIIKVLNSKDNPIVIEYPIL
jgi:hypothetical protein